MPSSTRLPDPAAAVPVCPLPETAVLECGCGGEMTRLDQMTVLVNCAGCGQPQLRIDGCPGHLIEILRAFAPQGA